MGPYESGLFALRGIEKSQIAIGARGVYEMTPPRLVKNSLAIAFLTHCALAVEDACRLT